MLTSPCQAANASGRIEAIHSSATSQADPSTGLLAIQSVRAGGCAMSDVLQNGVLRDGILPYLARQDYDSLRVALPALRGEIVSIRALAQKPARSLRHYEQRWVVSASMHENPARLAVLGAAYARRCKHNGGPDDQGDSFGLGASLRADRTLVGWAAQYQAAWQPVLLELDAFIERVGDDVRSRTGRILSSAHRSYPLGHANFHFDGVRTMGRAQVSFSLDELTPTLIALVIEILQRISEQGTGAREAPAFARCLAQVMAYRFINALHDSSLPDLPASFAAQLKARHAQVWEQGGMIARCTPAGPLRAAH